MTQVRRDSSNRNGLRHRIDKKIYPLFLGHFEMPKRKETQIDKFKAAARDLGTDDNEKRFNEKLGKIARQKPAIKPTKKPKR